MMSAFFGFPFGLTDQFAKGDYPPSEEIGIDALAPVATPAMWQFNDSLPNGVLLRDETMRSISGWLAPDGTLWACRWHHHRGTMLALGYVHERDIEAAGFLKLTNLQWLLLPRFTAITPSPEQLATIQRWYRDNQFNKAHLDSLLRERRHILLEDNHE